MVKEAPTEQQPSQPGVPKRFLPGQTVCNEKNEKGKLCSGHLKQLRTGGEEARKHLRGDDVLFKCQTCGALYMGPPLGHVRDPEKQTRFVEKDLTAILQAAGGTLPFFSKSKKVASSAETAPAKPTVAPVPATSGTAAPADETPEQKKARLIAEAKARAAAAREGKTTPAAKPAAKSADQLIATTSGTDSSAQADAHRPAAEAQAATGQASAAPMSPAAATASPAAGAETPADLAPDASTELTPGAPRSAASTTADSPTPLVSEGLPTDEAPEHK